MLGRHMYVHYRRPVETHGRIAVCSLEALGRAHLRRWQCGSKPVILDYVEWAHSGLFTSSRLVHPGPPNELGFLHSKPLGSHGNQPLVTVFVPRVFPRSPPIIDIISCISLVSEYTSLALVPVFGPIPTEVWVFILDA